LTSFPFELWSIDFANDTIGYAIGSSVVLKTTNGGVTFINNYSNEIPEEFILHQNYPNPFNPSTKFRFNIPPSEGAGGRILKIIIYDILGREITTLANEQLSPGTYEISWDASNYPSGVYYYQLTAGDKSFTRKMILMK